MGRTLALLIAGAALLALAGTAAGGRPAAVEAELSNTASLVSVGDAVDVTLVVTCRRRFDVLEANLSVSQGNTFGFTGFNIPRCDNKPHTIIVRVPGEEGRFTEGDAFSSLFVLVVSRGKSEATEQVQDVETIVITS